MEGERGTQKAVNMKSWRKIAILIKSYILQSSFLASFLTHFLPWTHFIIASSRENGSSLRINDDTSTKKDTTQTTDKVYNIPASFFISLLVLSLE